MVGGIEVNMKKFINQKDMKQSNTVDIFGLIRKSGRITRRQIADKTEMSWGAVSTITSRLIDEGYISEVKSDESALGRTPHYLEVNGEKHVSLGVDVNCSGLRAVIMNLRNEITDTFTAQADMTDRETLLSGIYNIVENAMAAVGERHLICIGIAMQGITDAENGISLSLPDCNGWIDLPLAYILEKKYSLPVHIEHDPNCILYAVEEETRRDTALVRIDKGIGMAVMIGGRMIDKPGIFELGHTVVEPEGEPCRCGKRGCLEIYVTMVGLEKRSGLSFAELARQAREGDPDKKRYFDELADHLALTLANFAGLMCLDSIVLCGDMLRYSDLFETLFYEKMGKYDINKRVTVELCDVESAAKGAAMLATKDALRRINIEKQ